MNTLPRNTDKLHARARAAKSRWLIRSAEYRQRDLAGGVWVKLREPLARAERAYAISEADAAGLEAAGHVALAPGLAIEPQLRAYVISTDVLGTLPSAEEIPVRMDERLLRSGWLALVPFRRP